MSSSLDSLWCCSFVFVFVCLNELFNEPQSTVIIILILILKLKLSTWIHLAHIFINPYEEIKKNQGGTRNPRTNQNTQLLIIAFLQHPVCVYSNRIRIRFVFTEGSCSKLHKKRKVHTQTYAINLFKTGSTCT